MVLTLLYRWIDKGEKDHVEAPDGRFELEQDRER